MTAQTSSGDSGGPVVDTTGHVVALNVAGNPVAPAQNLAVPINLAQAFLRAAGIRPDPGPLTAHRLSGQEAFWQKRYRRALKSFKTVAELQSTEQGVGRTDPLVAEMIERCEQFIAAGEDRSPLWDRLQDLWRK